MTALFNIGMGRDVYKTLSYLPKNPGKNLLK